MRGSDFSLPSPLFKHKGFSWLLSEDPVSRVVLCMALLSGWGSAAASAGRSGHWLLCSHYSAHIHACWVFLPSYFGALSWNWPDCQRRMLKQLCNSWALETMSGKRTGLKLWRNFSL